MNPIPLGWCLAGAAGTALLGAFGGWTVSDWRHDSKALDALADATKAANDSAAHMRAQGDLYEKDRQDDQSQSTVRESRINTIYHDIGIPADCAVLDAAGSVLYDAIGAANARRTGESASGLPSGGSEAVPVP
ncbi:hypothetical protein [Novosphingobium sp. AP12]|uniref:hypothetical protein n=1 Tax=Novosphingobium sp. AP12 TaxID=1144305 RepID=UPI000271E207|nr:hypothetical protein [Novosphingobium sp. AP12]EJL34463.1 hypothetical protein PMI02_00609 [Novosphingobium sp. AP12]